MHTAPTAAAALAWTRWTRDALVFIYPTFLHLVLLITGDRRPRPRMWLRGAYVTSLLFLVANNVGLFAVGMHQWYWGYFPIAGPAAKIYTLAFHATIWYATYLLYRAARAATGYRRNQLRIMLLATVFVFISADSNFLAAFGKPIYPFGSVCNIIFSLMFAYSITAFGFLNVQIVLRKSVMYASLAGALTLTYILIESLIKRMFMEHDMLSTSYAFHVAALPLTLAFAPKIRDAIEPVMQRVPGWHTHDREKIFKGFGQTLLTILNLDELARSTVTHLRALLNTDDIVLYVQTSNSQSYENRASIGCAFPSHLDSAHPAIRYLAETHKPLDREHYLWESGRRRPGAAADEVADFLNSSGLYLLMPLFLRGVLIGALMLGPKQNGDMYNSDDYRLLETLVGQLAVAVSNARAINLTEHQQRQIDYQKEMVTMGVLATEMAHELTKPLTHIMNAGSQLGASVVGTSRDKVRTIAKEVQRASEILDGFAMLSPERQLHRIAVPIVDLVEESINALGIADDPKIRITREFDPLPPLFVNPGQIVQVLTNLIQNAWHAMSDGGQLTIALHGIRSASVVSGIEMSITDTGPGIPADIQKKVFAPFFTTKRARGGQGMGLAISRAMTERHGGTITIHSPNSLQRGTRVVVRLPVTS